MKFVWLDEWGTYDESDWDKIMKRTNEVKGSLSVEMLKENYDKLKAYDGSDEGCGDMVLDKMNDMEESKEKEPIRFELKPRDSFFDIFK